MSGFVHLHLHSEYSLLDGACRIRDIPAAALAAGQSAVAVTDHGVMYGAVAFYRACKAAGVKPIIGCEMYVAPSSRFSKIPAERESDHLILLCRNAEGYKNLIKLDSLAFTEGFYGKPRIDNDLLERYSSGLIALSGCISGAIPRALLRGDEERAEKLAEKYRELFGPDGFYLELQSHGLEAENSVREKLISLGKKLSIPFAATNDVHYLEPEDAETQAALMCISTGSTMQEGRPEAFEEDEYYFKSEEEMRSLFRDLPEAVDNTGKIADLCDFDFDFDHRAFPRYVPEDGSTPDRYLRALAFAGLEKKAASGEIVYDEESEDRCSSAYRMRLEYELLIIHNMGFDEYFLTVMDFVRWAREHDVPTGPGRGSGAGSLTAYLIGITEVDSLRYGLLFERFLNPERISMPDFDIDFGDEKRDRVIAYVAEKYGNDRVAQIATFGTMAARAAVRDVGRALGMAYADVDRIARLIPQRLGITLSDALADPELKSAAESTPDSRRLMRLAAALEGMPRHMSTHAAGVVITDRPVSEYVPLAVSGDAPVTQFDMDTVAALGLLKFDFLGLRYLTVIDNAVKMIQKEDPSFSIEKIPTDDSAAFELISAGKTAGVFQLESSGIRQMLQSLRPASIEDIMIAIALYRPGPMESIPKYLENRKAPEKIAYPIPELEEVLAPTCGCIVYQEQVMQIFRIAAGYSYGKADVVRRAMSKKKADVMEAEREKFLAGTARKGIEPQDAVALFEEMAGFAAYAFNKSHAAGYAVLSYRTAYLKANYFKYYMAALLTSVLGNMPKSAEYMTECEHAYPRPVRILPPDINRGVSMYSVEGDDIRFGLAAVKGVGTAFVKAVAEKRRDGEFVSFEDYAERMTGVDSCKRQTEALIRVGAFDRLGLDRATLLASYETVMDRFAEGNVGKLEGQIGLFDGVEEIGKVKFDYPTVAPLSSADRLALEREGTGMYFSGHPLDEFSDNISASGAVPIHELLIPETENRFSGKEVTAVGIVSGRVNKTTKKNENMAFARLEDRYSEMELILFPSALTTFGAVVAPGRAVCVTGRMSFREEEEPKLIVSSASLLKKNGEFVAPVSVPRTANGAGGSPAVPGTASREVRKPQRLFLRASSMDDPMLRRALAVADIFGGPVGLVVYDGETKSYHARQGSGVTPSDFVLKELAELLGKENVVLK